jgi:rhodanese-related sulfurtransferase
MKNVIITAILIIGLVWFVGYITNEGPTTKGVADMAISDNSILKLVGPDEFYSLSEDDNNILIDIRTPDEYNSGHLKNAINIDYYAQTFKNELNKLDKDNTYLIYCRSGNRTETAMQIMKGLGFNSVYVLEGGINSWTAGNLPVCVNC